MSNRILMFSAGVAGALGVTVSAIAAHGNSPNAATAASFLLAHAPALLAIGLVAYNNVMRWSAVVLIMGLVLFVGDLSSRDFLDDRLFAMAAPAGGFLLILGWIGIAGSVFFPRRLL
jgi:uncharacterized membrane protein YgdD (TMEM256/DUF423 family)